MQNTNKRFDQLKMKNVRYKYYAKDEHKSLNGHTVHMDAVYLDDALNICEKHIILTSKDLFISMIKKLEYQISRSNR